MMVQHFAVVAASYQEKIKQMELHLTTLLHKFLLKFHGVWKGIWGLLAVCLSVWMDGWMDVRLALQGLCAELQGMRHRTI